MPTKRRRLARHAHGPRALRPSVLYFVETGDLSLAEADNPWLVVSLIGHRETLRQALAADDPAVRTTFLAKIPAADKLFL